MRRGWVGAAAVVASALLSAPIAACTSSSDAGEAPSSTTRSGGGEAETPTSGSSRDASTSPAGDEDPSESSPTTDTTDAKGEPVVAEPETESQRDRRTTDMTPWTVTHDIGPSRTADDAQPVTTTTWGFQTEPTPGGGRPSVDAG